MLAGVVVAVFDVAALLPENNPVVLGGLVALPVNIEVPVVVGVLLVAVLFPAIPLKGLVLAVAFVAGGFVDLFPKMLAPMVLVVAVLFPALF